MIRVFVFKEPTYDGPRVWVAQALEYDMAAQAHIDGEPFDAIEALGHMFDAHDIVCIDNPVEELRAAPEPYHKFWNRGAPAGTHQLGIARVCEVRIGEWEH